MAPAPTSRTRPNYEQILLDFNIPEMVDAGQVDEVWMFAFPYGGFYESRMAGPGAFFCNAPPLSGAGSGTRRYVIMGFNPERGIGEMLESFGHRCEDTLRRVYRSKTGEANLFERFCRYDQKYPGAAEVGTIHFAPNSEGDYDWGNPHPVPSRCDTWLNFPDLGGAARTGHLCRLGLRRHPPAPLLVAAPPAARQRGNGRHPQ